MEISEYQQFYCNLCKKRLWKSVNINNSIAISVKSSLMVYDCEMRMCHEVSSTERILKVFKVQSLKFYNVRTPAAVHRYNPTMQWILCKYLKQ